MKSRFAKLFYSLLLGAFFITPRFASAQSTLNFNVDVSASDYTMIKTLALPGNQVGALVATPNNNNVYLWVYNSSGTQVTNAEITSYINWQSTEKIYTEFNAIVTNNGNIFIIYTASVGDYLITDVARFFIINTSGTLQTSGQLNTTDPGSSLTRFIQVDKLSNGKIVAVFLRTDNMSWAFRIFNENGTPFTANDVVFAGPGTPNTFGGEVLWESRVGAFKNGNFLISLHYFDGNMYGLLFDNNGSAISVGGSSNFVLDGRFSDDYNNKAIMPLANGNVAAVWRLNGVHYVKIVNNTGGTVQAVQAISGGTRMGNFVPDNTAGAEGFLGMEYTLQDAGDMSNPNSSTVIKKYNQLGVLQSTTALQGFLIAPVYFMSAGASGGYAYMYSYYKSYIPYPEDWDYDLTSDADIKGVTNGFSMSTLPVVVTGYTVKLLSNHTAQLTWNTASEINNNYFEIKKSTDGRNFVAIGRVNATGNNTAPASYNFTDPEIIKHKTWYKLMQVDMDGAEKELGIRLVSPGKTITTASVYPNPVKGNIITINTGDESLPAAYQLTDVHGRIIKTGAFRLSQEQMDVQALPDGIYFLRIGVHQIIKIKK